MLLPQAQQLLKSCGFISPYKVQILSGGGNNQTFFVQTNTQRVLLKSYYFDPSDDRKRAANDFSFTKYAWECGCRSIPQPLGCDLEQHIALFEFINGESCFNKEPSELWIKQALDFIECINQRVDKEKKALLAPASESCFCINEHIQLISSRIQRLISEIDRSSELATEAIYFIEKKLLPAWTDISQNIFSLTAKPNQALLLEQQLASPSDFGFHNALLKPDGKLAFIDFEYAGRDDPAKLCGDFFSQSAVRVPEKYIGTFVDKIVSIYCDTEEQAASEHDRIMLLIPAYGIKWCCILLNEFLASAARRRKFAKGDQALERRAEQLQKAQLQLAWSMAQK